MQLLFLSTRIWCNIKTAVAFFITWVLLPDEDNWAKLWCIIQYLTAIPSQLLTLETLTIISGWCSFSGASQFQESSSCNDINGQGICYRYFKTLKINTKTSTEAELIGVSDTRLTMIWADCLSGLKDISHILPFCIRTRGVLSNLK